MSVAPAATAGAVKRAYAWTAAGNAVSSVLGIAISLVLARLLSPNDYGLIGMVIVFTSFLSAIQESGLGQAVIYFNDESPATLPTHYTVNIVTGVILAALTSAAAPGLAWFYDMPPLTLLAQVMSVTFIFNGFRAVSHGLLARQYLFRDLMVIDMKAGFTAAFLAVALAWFGFGVWSLVTNLVLSSFLQMVMVLKRVPPKWTFHPDWSCIRRVVHWGAPLTGSSIAWRLYDNADYVVIGKMLGEHPLGIYTFAFRLATMVNDKIGSVVSRVSFVNFASLKNSRDEAAKHWHTLTKHVTLAVFPLLAALAVNAEDVIRVLVGEKWLASVQPMQFLCIVGALKSLTPITYNLLSGLGRTDLGFKFTLMNLVVLFPAFAAGCYFYGMTGVCLAWLIGYPPICAWIVWQGTRVTETPIGDYLSVLRFPVLTAAACMAAMFAAGAVLESGWVRLLLRCTVGLVCYVAALYINEPTRRQLTDIVSKVRTRIAVA
jgi:O-antigen/teichoic acid export membrane protein